MVTLAPDAPAISASERENTYRRNFALFLTDGILFSVAMALLGTTTVIPDFVRNLTDSEILIGFSGSLFEIGWTLPQLFIARYVVRFERKKWWFAGPNIPVRFVILIFAVGEMVSSPRYYDGFTWAYNSTAAPSTSSSARSPTRTSARAGRSRTTWWRTRTGCGSRP